METRPVRLITIPISHYCEKARWALKRAGIPYREEGHLQLMHVLALKRAGAKGDEVPTLVTPDEVIEDSTRILHWADARTPVERRLYPEEPALRAEVEALEEEFDESLGIASRRWVYGHLLDRYDLALKYGRNNVPRWEAAPFPLVFPVVKEWLLRLVEVTPESMRQAERTLDETFARVGTRLSDGRRYLMGDRFTAADLSFASLAAAVLMPDSYGTPLPQVEELPEKAAGRVAAWRETPAGRYVLGLYSRER